MDDLKNKFRKYISDILDKEILNRPSIELDCIKLELSNLNTNGDDAKELLEDLAQRLKDILDRNDK